MTFFLTAPIAVSMVLAAPSTVPPSPSSETKAPATATPEPLKEVTRYSFTGLGIDGELRTPALLQFLSRIGGEFETSGIPHRSFMPELQRTRFGEDYL